MSKIIGITVGTQLPKPNFNQTDPTKGDYIKNKPDFDGLQSTVDSIGTLVGDTAVADQISAAIDVLRAEIDENKITIEEIDEICGSSIISASEVEF